jgi:staphylococcal nuclease domain-containing protein 1
LVVGKEVAFVPEYIVPTTNREYGSLFLANGDNVAELGVKEGWLKVREGGKTREDQEEALEKLQQLQDEAEAAGVGMWDQDKGKVNDEIFVKYNGAYYLLWVLGYSRCSLYF